MHSFTGRASTQALNGPTRAALVSLSAGGNRAGAAAVLAWQTGFPAAADFARGAPRYRAEDDVATWMRTQATQRRRISPIIRGAKASSSLSAW